MNLKNKKRRYNLNKKLKLIVFKIFSYFMFIFRAFPINGNKIYVINFTNKGYSDNPKYIIKKILEKSENIKIYWKTNSGKFPDDRIIPVIPHSILDLYHLSTSKVILSNVRFPLYYKKRKKQFYIETWHGSIAMKKIGFDGNNRNVLSDAKVKHFSKSCNLLTSNSLFSNDLYRRAFKYNGRIEMVGTPRVDALFMDNKQEKLKERLKISSDEIIITYAPTFREKGMDGFKPLDYKKIIEAFQIKLNKKVKLLFRLHPTKKMNIGDCKPGIIVTDDIMDLYETLSITDILISDYSSLIFEYMILRRPIIQYIPDYDSYFNTRGVYFNINEMPFVQARSTDELVEIIKEKGELLVNQRLEGFIEKLGVFENGNASEIVSNIIIYEMEK